MVMMMTFDGERLKCLVLSFGCVVEFKKGKENGDVGSLKSEFLKRGLKSLL